MILTISFDRLVDWCNPILQTIIIGFGIMLLIILFVYAYSQENSNNPVNRRSISSDFAPNTRSRKSSLRSPREDKQRSDQEGYRRGMEDAIFGDSYHYIRGVKGSDSYRNGYIRGYEENCWCDED